MTLIKTLLFTILLTSCHSFEYYAYIDGEGGKVERCSIGRGGELNVYNKDYYRVTNCSNKDCSCIQQKVPWLTNE